MILSQILEVKNFVQTEKMKEQNFIEIDYECITRYFKLEALWILINITQEDQSTIETIFDSELASFVQFMNATLLYSKDLHMTQFCVWFFANLAATSAEY